MLSLVEAFIGFFSRIVIEVRPCRLSSRCLVKYPKRSVLRSPYRQRKQSPCVDKNGHNGPRMFADERGKNLLGKPNTNNNGDLSKTYVRCIGWSCYGTGFAKSFLWSN